MKEPSADTPNQSLLMNMSETPFAQRYDVSRGQAPLLATVDGA